MNAYQFKQTVLTNKNNVNFIAKNVDGTYMVLALNRALKAYKYACKGNKYINYKTLKGALNSKVAKANGGINVVVIPNGTDMANASYTILK